MSKQGAAALPAFMQRYERERNLDIIVDIADYLYSKLATDAPNLIFIEGTLRSLLHILSNKIAAQELNATMIGLPYALVTTDHFSQVFNPQELAYFSAAFCHFMGDIKGATSIEKSQVFSKLLSHCIKLPELGDDFFINILYIVIKSKSKSNIEQLDEELLSLSAVFIKRNIDNLNLSFTEQELTTGDCIILTQFIKQAGIQSLKLFASMSMKVLPGLKLIGESSLTKLDICFNDKMVMLAREFLPLITSPTLTELEYSDLGQLSVAQIVDGLQYSHVSKLTINANETIDDILGIIPYLGNTALTEYNNKSGTNSAFLINKLITTLKYYPNKMKFLQQYLQSSLNAYRRRWPPNQYDHQRHLEEHVYKDLESQLDLIPINAEQEVKILSSLKNPLVTDLITIVTEYARFTPVDLQNPELAEYVTSKALTPVLNSECKKEEEVEPRISGLYVSKKRKK